MDPYRTGPRGMLWKFARCVDTPSLRLHACLRYALTPTHARRAHSVGERLSPYVSLACICMGLSMLWY